MTSDVSEGLKIPTRPAPPPPKVDGTNGHLKKSTTFALAPSKAQNERKSDKYIYQSVPRSRSTSDIFGGRKKPPPPRPPPPKIPPMTNVANSQQKPQSIKIKLPGFKSRKKHHSSKPHVHVSSWRATPNKSHPLVGSLIDLQSPAQSPGFNNDSSSDDSSVDSFDSDDPSSNENQNDYNNGWNSSQVESGFEDDFDRLSTPSSSDPWSDSRSDPFSPQRRSAPLPANQFDISNDDPKTRKLVNFSSSSNFKPTVIRPAIPIKSRKPPPSPSNDFASGSPPMPSIPPPPPPPEAFDLLANGPPIPPRPTKSFKAPDKSQIPHCIALFDYTGDHVEDLSFKENDKIILKRFVNEEWLEGDIDGKSGIFPVCFVKVIISPPKEGEISYGGDTKMITLFNYHAQSWDDLDLKEGDLIRVIGKVDENWLYGECNGKQGQFPVTYAAEYLLD
ncbi:uncharacterized protein l(3)05822 [Planococcus citri]|uniref:uncharacterized protein l(3)05822 n=1 Tax=Planococcus citri TaxID=170843 RepID=UPI0031F9C691